MRRPILTVLTLLLAVALIGCGEDPDAAERDTTPPTVGAQDGEPAAETVELTFRIDAADSGLVDQTVQTLRNRLEALGLAGVELRSEGEQLSVRVPDAAAELVRESFTTGGELEFRPVLAPTSDAPDPAVSGDEAGEVVLASAEGEAYRLGPVAFGGEVVETASANLSPQGMWVVDLVLNEGPEGVERFNEVAEQCHAGEPVCPGTATGSGQLAIVLDGVVVSAPVIHVPSFERDQIQISGAFDENAAQALAVALRFGAVPADVVEAD